MKIKILHLIIIAATLGVSLQAHAENIPTENVSSPNAQIATTTATTSATISTANNFRTQMEHNRKIDFIKNVTIKVFLLENTFW